MTLRLTSTAPARANLRPLAPPRTRWLAALTAVAGLAGLGTSAVAAAELPRVRMETSMGTIIIEVDTDRAPLTAANFLQYVKDGFYTGTIIHRVENNFVLQGGGYDAQLKPKQGRAPVANEAGNGLSNVRGTVGLARTGNPHSGTSQFYVNISDNEVLNPNPARWGYAVFGRVVEGLEVVDRIGQQPTGDAGPFKGTVPVETILIRRVSVIPGVAVQPAAPAAAPAPAPVPLPAEAAPVSQPAPVPPPSAP
jgi:peptidyl-prolyl cis-trans isomerase A (cyclophilin A)